MKAIDFALAGIVDYAGLYPPANLDIESAIRNYLDYRKGPRANMLGRFIVELARLNELRQAAGSLWRKIRLSVLAPANADWQVVIDLVDRGYLVEAIEARTSDPFEIERIVRSVPAHVECYFEIPITPRTPAAVEAFASTGCRAKLRMGGITAEAFPPSQAVVAMLKTLAQHRIPFKATAGLHHPLRSRHAFTYVPKSAAGMMHGFVNLLCAAALIHFHSDTANALTLLNEEDPRAWDITAEAIAWRGFSWTGEELRTVRQTFFISFGSCSFTEPIHDLEVLTWL